MYSYAAGSPKTYGGYSGGFGLVTHAQAQAQAALDFQAKYGHATPQSLAEANWLDERTAALKAVTGTEQEVVTRTVQVRPPGSVLGPLRVNEYRAALGYVRAYPTITAQLNAAIAFAAQGTDAAVERSESVYMGAVAAAASSGGARLPLLKDYTSTKTVTSGGGVPSAASGTASVLKNLADSIANIFKMQPTTTPAGIPLVTQPVGGIPYQALPPVQTSAGAMLSQRIGPLTVGQLAMGGGAALIALGAARRMIPLAIIGAVAAAGTWFMGRKG